MTNLLLHHLIFSLLLLPLFMVDAQTKSNISIGSSLTAGNSNELWVSPSEDFAFGFHQFADDSFIPAIWYYKLSGQITTVWYANEGKPAPRNSTLELTANGLVLRNGAQQLWSSRKTSSAEVTYAVMNDTGNFVLMKWNSKPIWESFHNPTDTLLPSQIMELGGFLSSRTSNNDFSPRRFQFRFEDGVASLVNINLPGNFIYSTYYTTETVDASNSSYQVVFDVLGLYGLGRNGSNFFIIKSEDPNSTSSDLYKRVNLNFDGTLTLSSHPKDPSAGNETWRTIRSIPDNICLAVNGEVGGGVCGFNSICSIQSDGRPNCICPDGYSLFNTSDQYGGCRPNFLLGCDNRSGQIQLESIPGVNFPYSDYAVLSNISEKDCQNNCKHDCLCAAVIFDLNSMRCWKKRPPLSNGRYEVSATVAYLKTANNSSPQIPHSPPQVPEKDQNIVAVVVLSVLLGSSVLVNFVFVGAICMGFFVFFKRKLLGLHISPNESSVENRLQHFTYKELTEATNGFKEELGRGSCGIVYKGETRSTGLIAVKMLDRVFEDIDREFKAEVNIIGQTHHKNLLRLVGYCDEKQHRLLVYEFLKNGTLARFLYGDLKPSWKQRTQIALGIARGLIYLHEECSKQIIHCDIKPQNILLDEYYNARISDFGLAKLLLINQSYTKTNIRGTKGYVAPDWFRSAPVSVKVDVYSFGVVLLEIICCRRNVLNMEVGEVHKRILTDYAYDCYMEGKLDALIENDMEAMEDIKMVERFVMVAIWCIQEDPNKRPTMKKVMLMLEGILQVSVPPTPFSFTSIEIVH